MIPGDPAAVEAGTVELERAMAGLESGAVAVARSARMAGEAWSGPAAAAADQAFGRYGEAVRAGVTACAQLVPVLRTYATELRAAQEMFARGETMEQQAQQALTVANAPEPVGVLYDPAALRTATDAVTGAGGSTRASTPPRATG